MYYIKFCRRRFFENNLCKPTLAFKKVTVRMCKSKDKRFLHRITHNELLAIVPGMDAKGIARIPLETIKDNIFENNRMRGYH